MLAVVWCDLLVSLQGQERKKLTRAKSERRAKKPIAQFVKESDKLEQ